MSDIFHTLTYACTIRNSVTGPLDQLIVGLNSFDVMDAVKENQSCMEPIFVEKYAARFLPTANTLLDEIIPDFSENGSNLKIK